MPTCHICGRDLPNRFSIGGSEVVDGETRYYCHLHWREKQATPKTPEKADDFVSPAPPEKFNLFRKMKEKREDKQSRETARRMAGETLQLLKKLGAGASGLIARLRNAKSPEEIEREITEARRANRKKREETSARLETLYNEIATGKQELAKAPAARRRVLETELRTKLKEYQGAERTFTVYSRNEEMLGLVQSRIEEVAAHGMAGINEDFVDDLTDRLDEAADDADSRFDALRDLERAGKTRQPEGSTDDLMTALEGFGELEGNESPTPQPEETKEKTTEKKGDPLEDFGEPER